MALAMLAMILHSPKLAIAGVQARRKRGCRRVGGSAVFCGSAAPGRWLINCSINLPGLPSMLCGALLCSLDAGIPSGVQAGHLGHKSQETDLQIEN